MYRFILILLFLYCFIFTTKAQQETGEDRGRGASAENTSERSSVAPINWQFYKISEQKISILLPKLPVFTRGVDRCNEETSENYAVYADGVVYGFSIKSKLDKLVKHSCPNFKRFNESNYENRIKEIKTIYRATEEGLVTHGKHNFLKLKSSNSDFWLINDFQNKRWFELWISGGNVNSDKVKNFLASLELNTSIGIEIANGSPYTLGDEVKTDSTISLSSEAIKDSSMKVAFKIRPNYTDLAREKQTVGTCTLSVTFLANGSVGSVSVVSGLPNGLTEQAIEAARKIVFIPTVKNGVFYTVTRQVQYNFTLY